MIAQNRVAGMLAGNDMLAALARHGVDYPVTEVMRREFLVAESAEPLDRVYQRFGECGCSTIPVFRNGWLVGLITTENLGEYLSIDATLRSYDESLLGRNAFGDRLNPSRSMSSDRL